MKLKSADLKLATLILPLCLVFHSTQGADTATPLFTDVAKKWGLTRLIVYGSSAPQKYLLEGHGGGVAVFDYDNDGRPDLFFTNGSRLEGYENETAPVSMLYRNAGGRFEDMTDRSGLARAGWGQGACIGDYDNDGWTDLYVTYYGHNVLYRNKGDGTFEDRTEAAQVHSELRWGAGCGFLDHDRDGDLDLFVANYVAYEHAAAFAVGSQPDCVLMGVPVPCGPRGLKRDYNSLYKNNGDGTFSDVSRPSGVYSTDGHYSFQPVTLDFDRDGWTDIYISCDSTPNILLHNQGDGTFTDVALLSGSALSGIGHEQAGMGVGVGDFDRDGLDDIVVTNFSEDRPTLYQNLGEGFFADVTLEAGLGRYLQYVGWGALFLDWDNDGWEDLFMVNGHIYTEADKYGIGSYKQAKLLYRNRADGSFEDRSEEGGPDILRKTAARGSATEDFDGDGYLDLIVTHLREVPSLLLNHHSGANWVMVQLEGGPSNRSAIGARVIIESGGERQSREVRSTSSFLSASGLRLHFGLGKLDRIGQLEVHWPSGKVSRFNDLTVNRVLFIGERDGLRRN